MLLPCTHQRPYFGCNTESTGPDAENKVTLRCATETANAVIKRKKIKLKAFNRSKELWVTLGPDTDAYMAALVASGRNDLACPASASAAKVRAHAHASTVSAYSSSAQRSSSASPRTATAPLAAHTRSLQNAGHLWSSLSFAVALVRPPAPDAPYILYIKYILNMCYIMPFDLT